MRSQSGASQGLELDRAATESCSVSRDKAIKLFSFRIEAGVELLAPSPAQHVLYLKA